MTTFTRLLVTLAAFTWQIILHSNAFVTSSGRVTPVILASSGSGAHLINDDLYRHIIEKCVNDDIDRIANDNIKRILKDAHKMMKLEKPLLRLSTPVGGNLTVLGDVHGQFVDVLKVFRLNGLPSKDNVYVFNGDLVDRGPQGLEIVLMLLAFKLMMKSEGLYILRGNHETARMNSQYGFEKEFRRFGIDGETLYDLTNEIFDELPYAAVIDAKVFVVHGGPVGDSKRGYITALEDIVKFTKGKQPDFNSMEEGFLWSDPGDIGDQAVAPSPRGAGFLWGKQVTKQFLVQNKLSFLIRSHQVVMQGFEYFHEDQAMTLFSAPNYCGLKNKAAFYRFQNSADGDKRVSTTSTVVIQYDGATTDM